MLRVGLTGGMGAGKSTVAARLAEHGAMVIDADAIAREVVEPGTEGLAEIVHAFGDDVLAADGSLDRPALAEKAFGTDEARQRLNAIMHPRIGARTVELMAGAAADAIVVHDIPLLVESGLSAHYHLTVVVDAPVATRVRRLAESRGIDPEDARVRIEAQATEKERLAAADVWLGNAGTTQDILSEVDALWTGRLVPFEANVRLRRGRAAAPARIGQYDPTWQRQAERLMARVRRAAGERALRIDHIGSTAVPGLAATDVIDLQVSVRSLAEADELAEPLGVAGFVRDPEVDADTPLGPAAHQPGWWKRLHTNADPGRPVNLHLRVDGQHAQRYALLFRDWLRADSAARDEYVAVREKLAAEHATDAAYTVAKRSWLDRAFHRAEQWAHDSGWRL